MKKVNKSPEPPKLKTYITNPANLNRKWGDFAGSRGRRTEVQKQIEADQNGLCAYCENSFDVPDDEVNDLSKGRNKRDFTVEHFHPKSPPNPNPPPNYAIQWSNLLGACSGGDQKGTRRSLDGYSCNAKKKDNNLVGVILNPLVDVPAFPRLFSYARSGADIGKMYVDKKECPEHLQDQAEQTIEELGLNSPRLLRFRSKIIDKLKDQLNNEITKLTQSGLTDDQATDKAMSFLAESFLVVSSENTKRKRFFTCIRWYLADKAEDQLKTINYNG